MISQELVFVDKIGSKREILTFIKRELKIGRLKKLDLEQKDIVLSAFTEVVYVFYVQWLNLTVLKSSEKTRRVILDEFWSDCIIWDEIGEKWSMGDRTVSYEVFKFAQCISEQIFKSGTDFSLAFFVSLNLAILHCLPQMKNMMKLISGQDNVFPMSRLIEQDIRKITVLLRIHMRQSNRKNDLNAKYEYCRAARTVTGLFGHVLSGK